MSWLDIFKKNVTVSHAPTVTLPPLNTSGNFYNYNANTTAAVAPAGQQMGTIQVNSGIAGVAAAGNGGNFSFNNGGAGGAIGGGFGNFTINAPTPTYIIQFGNSGSEIVRLNLDGTVTWAGGVDIDAAADAFGKSLQLGAEIRSGVTKSVKLKMRDSVFEDLINIAKEKGSLTAEDLTYLLEASKIVEKLKGGS